MTISQLLKWTYAPVTATSGTAPAPVNTTPSTAPSNAPALSVTVT